eukprot:tig00020944_g16373.t1
MRGAGERVDSGRVPQAGAVAKRPVASRNFLGAEEERARRSGPSSTGARARSLSEAQEIVESAREASESEMHRQSARLYRRAAQQYKAAGDRDMRVCCLCDAMDELAGGAKAAARRDVDCGRALALGWAAVAAADEARGAEARGLVEYALHRLCLFLLGWLSALRRRLHAGAPRDELAPELLRLAGGVLEGRERLVQGVQDDGERRLRAHRAALDRAALAREYARARGGLPAGDGPARAAREALVPLRAVRDELAALERAPDPPYPPEEAQSLLGRACSAQGGLLLLLREYAEARDAFRAEAELHARSGDRRGHARAEAGRDQAERALRLRSELAEATGPPARLAAGVAYARHALALRDHREAERVLSAALEEAAREPSLVRRFEYAEAAFLMAQALFRGGRGSGPEAARAAGFAERAAKIAGAVGRREAGGGAWRGAAALAASARVLGGGAEEHERRVRGAIGVLRALAEGAPAPDEAQQLAHAAVGFYGVLIDARLRELGGTRDAAREGVLRDSLRALRAERKALCESYGVDGAPDGDDLEGEASDEEEGREGYGSDLEEGLRPAALAARLAAIVGRERGPLAAGPAPLQAPAAAATTVEAAAAPAAAPAQRPPPRQRRRPWTEEEDEEEALRSARRRQAARAALPSRRPGAAAPPPGPVAVPAEAGPSPLGRPPSSAPRPRPAP